MAATGAGDKPVVVHPNRGERWNAGARRWAGELGFASGVVSNWRRTGGRLVGGCCRVGPGDIRAVAAVLWTALPADGA